MADIPNIALRAFELWDAAGRPDGRSDEFYFMAEEELRLLLETETADKEISGHAAPTKSLKQV